MNLPTDKVSRVPGPVGCRALTVFCTQKRDFYEYANTAHWMACCLYILAAVVDLCFGFGNSSVSAAEVLLQGRPVPFSKCR